MILRILAIAGLYAAALPLFAAGQARASNCIIADDKKSISIITDNSSDEQKNCNVNCRVDTVHGVFGIRCGGQAPPKSKAHEMCNFDKPEPFYNKVELAEGTCN